MQSLIMEFAIAEKKVKVEEPTEEDKNQKKVTEKKMEKMPEKKEKKIDRTANNKKTSSVS